MPGERLDVGIVGAGMAGLAAAWELISAGARVTFYERSAQPGGRMRTDEVDGIRVDSAVQLLGSYFSETFRLAAAAGATSLLVRSPGRDALWRGGRPHELTYGSVASMLATSVLPVGLKLRLGTRYIAFLHKHQDVLDACQPVRAAAAGLDRESIGAWGTREMGEDFVELLVYPLLAAYYGAVPDQTSAGFYHSIARAGMDVTVRAVRGGAAELPRALLRAVEANDGRFLGGSAVASVGVGANAAEVWLQDRTYLHDAVIVAVPAPAALELLDLDGQTRSWLQKVRFLPAATLALALDAPAPAGFFGLSFPRRAAPGDYISAIGVQERKTPGLVPSGRGLLLVFPAPAVQARVQEATAEQALDLMLPAVEQAFPGISRRVTQARLFRFPQGMPLFYPGYLEHLRGFDERWLPARLALAGDYLVAPTVEGAVRSGRRAAARLLRAAGNGGGAR